jgi:hypothetical protein
VALDPPTWLDWTAHVGGSCESSLDRRERLALEGDLGDPASLNV